MNFTRTMKRNYSKLMFKQLFDSTSFTYTYIIADLNSKSCILIDPVLEKVERDIKLLKEFDLDLKYILDTHVHADHVTGTSKLMETFPNSSWVIGTKNKPNINFQRVQYVKDDDEISVDDIKLKVLETPGHTNGCISFYSDGRVFTGDTILVRACGRTDFQEGNANQLFDSIKNKIYKLPDETLLYPAHDYNGISNSSIKEEKLYNPRIFETQTREKFVEIMNNLNLAKPKLIHVAVPANLIGGIISK
jgi:sulfur dioxygenase